MKRRRNPLLVLAVFAIWSMAQSGHTATDRWPVGPVDSGAEFRDVDNVPEPSPVPEPAPPLITTPVIEVPEVVGVGEPLVATLRFDPPAGSRVKVDWHSTAPTLPVGNWEQHVWGAPGKHTIGARVVVVTADDIAVYEPSDTFTRGDPPPPEPDKPLVTLVTKEQAAALAKLYRAMATLPPPEDFWLAHDAALEARGLTGHGATAQIHKRLDAVLADAVKLNAELLKIADELAKPPGPTPPPVVEGKRRVVILRESGDDMPADARLYVQLRNDATAAYLKANGHTLEIADADASPLYQQGMTLPQLFILDAATGAVVNQQPRPATSAAILEAVKAHGG